MSDAYDVSDDKADWVEVTSQMLGFVRSPGVQMQSPADLTVLYSALQEHLTCSAFQFNTPTDAEPKSQESHGGSPIEAAFEFDSLALPSTALHTNKDALTPELCFSQFGEWSSRPDVSDLHSVIMSNSSSSCTANVSSSPPILVAESSDQQELVTMPWRLRHSSIFRWRIVDWLLRNLPSLLTPIASFLLGAATMFLLLKKRGKLPFLGHLPLE